MTQGVFEVEAALKKKLGIYIADLISDGIFYEELSKKAPDECQRRLLREFARDEMGHRDNFRRIYCEYFGEPLRELAVLPDVGGEYEELVREKMLCESRKFRKYGEQYILTDDEKIKDALYNLKSDKGSHALRLLEILSR